jgi:hypothetical protein
MILFIEYERGKFNLCVFEEKIDYKKRKNIKKNNYNKC